MKKEPRWPTGEFWQLEDTEDEKKIEYSFLLNNSSLFHIPVSLGRPIDELYLV